MINKPMIMKKILFTLVLMLMAQLSFAQTAKDVFNDYKDQKKAEYVSVPRAMLKLGAAAVKNNNTQALLDEIHSAKILTLDNCKKRVRKNFANAISNLSKKDYDEYTRMKDDGQNILILVKKHEDLIAEIVALINDDDDCVGILVTGDINPEDIEAVVRMVDDND